VAIAMHTPCEQQIRLPTTAYIPFRVNFCSFVGLQLQCAVLNDDLYDIKHPLCWMHTVRLTLHLQHSAELVLLLSPDALPLLEHLNVTIEQPQKGLSLRADQSTKRFNLSEQDLVRANVDSTKLRSLLLRQIRLDELVILLNALTYPRLDTLTLVDVWDQGECFRLSYRACHLSMGISPVLKPFSSIRDHAETVVG
jgi:hypothetical protein